MQTERLLIVRCGTKEPPPVPARLSAGALSVQIMDGKARQLCWHGVEVLRGIECPVRDMNWATLPQELAEENAKYDANRFEFERCFRIDGGALTGRLIYTGSADGSFRAVVELTANRNFSTNRAGFALLHPIAELAGLPVNVVHPDGSSESAQFPALISPQQPMMTIAKLVYRQKEILIDITFRGEIFEMEDQRNWSDASYKTYCRPLSRPFPYILAKGESVRQEIEIQLGGNFRGSNAASNQANNLLRIVPTKETVPVIALALDSKSIPNGEEMAIVRRIAPRVLQLRVLLESAEQTVGAAQAFIGREAYEVELETVVPQDTSTDDFLEELAKLLSRFSIHPQRVIALPEAYLRSYQPEGPWPVGPTPRETALAARKWFAGAHVGCGVLTNFAEFNRCRPDLSVCDYVTHGSTAIVHAADDGSVLENLEGLSHVFASGRALAVTHDYRLGLVSIGMRFNSYGPDVIANSRQLRLAMAEIDPRQRGLFAAAWAVGAVAATEQHNVASMALASPIGPFGMLYRRADWPQPHFDDRGRLAVYPIFHVVRALLQVAGAQRFSLEGLPHGVVGVACRVANGYRILLANTNDEPCTVILPELGSVRQLDEDTFECAIDDPDWLLESTTQPRSEIVLGSLNVAFVQLPKAPILV